VPSTDEPKEEASANPVPQFITPTVAAGYFGHPHA